MAVGLSSWPGNALVTGTGLIHPGYLALPGDLGPDELTRGMWPIPQGLVGHCLFRLSFVPGDVSWA